MNRALASSAKPNAHVENPDHSGTGFFDTQGDDYASQGLEVRS